MLPALWKLSAKTRLPVFVDGEQERLSVRASCPGMSSSWDQGEPHEPLILPLYFFPLCLFLLSCLDRYLVRGGLEQSGMPNQSVHLWLPLPPLHVARLRLNVGMLLRMTQSCGSVQVENHPPNCVRIGFTPWAAGCCAGTRDSRETGVVGWRMSRVEGRLAGSVCASLGRLMCRKAWVYLVHALIDKQVCVPAPYCQVFRETLTCKPTQPHITDVSNSIEISMMPHVLLNIFSLFIFFILLSLFRKHYSPTVLPVTPPALHRCRGSVCVFAGV